MSRHDRITRLRHMLDHAECLRHDVADDYRHAGFDDPRFLRSDVLQRVAEVLLMIEVDRCDRRGPRGQADGPKSCGRVPSIRFGPPADDVNPSGPTAALDPVRRTSPSA